MILRYTTLMGTEGRKGDSLHPNTVRFYFLGGSRVTSGEQLVGVHLINIYIGKVDITQTALASVYRPPEAVHAAHAVANEYPPENAFNGYSGPWQNCTYIVAKSDYSTYLQATFNDSIDVRNVSSINFKVEGNWLPTLIEASIITPQGREYFLNYDMNSRWYTNGTRTFYNITF